MAGPDLAAAADDRGARGHPAERMACIGHRAEIVARLQRLYRAARLHGGDGDEAVGVGAERDPDFRQQRHGGAHRLGAGAVDEHGVRARVYGGLRAGGDPLARAQQGAVGIVHRERGPDRLAALGRGNGRGARLGRRQHGLAQEEVHAVRLHVDDPAVVGEALVFGRRQVRAVAADQRRQAAGDPDMLSALLTGGFGCGEGRVVQGLEILGHALTDEPVRRRRVGVDRDDPRARLDEVEVHGLDEVRLVHHDLDGPERRRGYRAAAIEFLAHAAIEKDDFRARGRRRLGHACAPPAGRGTTPRRPHPKFSLRTMIATGDPRKQARASLPTLAGTRAACESPQLGIPHLHIGRSRPWTH